MKDLNEASLVARQARSRLKSAARAGKVSVAEVVIGNAEIMAPVRLADILKWGWPRMGEGSQLKVGKLAARRDLNLLLPVGRASRPTRQAFAELMWAVREGTEPRPSHPGEVGRAEWLLKKAEKDRDEALARVLDLERMVGMRQLVLPTVQAEHMLADLADAVELHRRTVSSPQSPADKWANADEALWERKNEILLSAAPPKLQAA